MDVCLAAKLDTSFFSDPVVQVTYSSNIVTDFIKGVLKSVHFSVRNVINTCDLDFVSQ